MTNFEKYFGTPDKLVRTAIEVNSVTNDGQPLFDIYLTKYNNEMSLFQTEYIVRQFDGEEEFREWLESDSE